MKVTEKFRIYSDKTDKAPVWVSTQEEAYKAAIEFGKVMKESGLVYEMFFCGVTRDDEEADDEERIDYENLDSAGWESLYMSGREPDILSSYYIPYHRAKLDINADSITLSIRIRMVNMDTTFKAETETAPHGQFCEYGFRWNSEADMRDCYASLREKLSQTLKENGFTLDCIDFPV